MTVPAAEPASRLSLDRVTLRYETDRGSAVAVDRISFEVAPAERLVLLGPSGCGKSTLLKAIGGFIQPAEGTILAQGRPIAAPGPDRMMVFQEFDQLLPWKTVRGNVMFPMQASRGLDTATAGARADRIIERVGLSGFGQAYPHTLSGGMKQRVAIARALALEPAVLLMDEPFGALDAMTRRRMQDELLGLWEELRFTLVFVTHSIDEAMLVGSRILVLTRAPARLRATAEVGGLGEASRQSPEFAEMSRRLRGFFSDANGLDDAA